ncbi:hypothetical protein JW933_09990 [candidate division FCPU426 bacterium]|nr:hypothetical protein [candidate division FCPU426 bacterium]
MASVQAWAEGTAGQAGAYLKLGVDARPLAMGSAYTAVCLDAAAGYWNPAALGLLDRQQVMVAYAAFPESGDYSQLAYVLPLREFSFPADNLSGSVGRADWGAIGATLLRYAAAYDIEARSTDSLNPDYLFSDIEGCYGLAYGRRFAGDWAAGIGVKGLYHELDQEQAGGWGVDAGLWWQAWPGLAAALAVRDVFSRLSWSTGVHEMFPVSLRAGAAWKVKVIAGHTLQLAADASHQPGVSDVGLHFGLEYGYHNVVFLRTGNDREAWSFGCGVRLPWIGWGRAALNLDYAAREDRIWGWDHWFTVRLEL